ncbi:glycoside hydrolase family 16 protein [Pseudonocardia endophytica]|nr:glycoside hydrolase family 16 protein [Pseudonocardia endophytica]
MRTALVAVPVAVAVAAGTAIGTASTAVAAVPAAGASAPAAPEPPAPEPPAASDGKCSQTAAKTLDWGTPTRESDFEGSTVPPDWHPYGPEPGHAKNGTRTPDAVTVAGGAMSINGSQDGTTGAVSWHPGQQYGRWEACVRADEGSGGLNALLLLWPVEENFPVGGEIDWMENMSDDRQETSFFLHYGADNQQEYGSVKHDATEWSAWALEWTPDKMTAYVNGKEWYSSTDTDHFPPGAMNMTMQLDYFGNAGGPSAMHMDWARQWALPESKPAELSLAPGAPATGQPKDYPDRAPRKLDGAAPPAGAGDEPDQSDQSDQDQSDQDQSDQSDQDKPDRSDQDDDGGSGDQAGSGSEGSAVAPSGDLTAGRPRLLHPSGAEPAGTVAGPRTRTLHPSTTG